MNEMVKTDFDHNNRFSIDAETDEVLEQLPNGTFIGQHPNSKYTERIGNLLIELVSRGCLIEPACQLVGISRKTLHNWKNPLHNSYEKEFAIPFNDAFKQSGNKFAEDAIVIIDDKSGDTYTDINKDGIEIEKPNNANVTRDKHRSDIRMKMAAIRDPENFSNAGIEGISEGGRNIIINLTQYGGLPDKKVEVVKEAEIEGPKEE
jgi:hypothetical protein